MKIIKRSGMEVEFDRSKIIAAVKRANNSVVEGEKVSDEQVEKIAENVETICEGMNRALNVEEIQDLVENQIMNQKAFRLQVIILLTVIRERWLESPILQISRF